MTPAHTDPHSTRATPAHPLPSSRFLWRRLLLPRLKPFLAKGDILIYLYS
jgi:hypothetical protein